MSDTRVWHNSAMSEFLINNLKRGHLSNEKWMLGPQTVKPIYVKLQNVSTPPNWEPKVSSNLSHLGKHYPRSHWQTVQPLTTRPKLGKCWCQNTQREVTQWQVCCCVRRTQPEADGAPRSTLLHSWHNLTLCILPGRRWSMTWITNALLCPCCLNFPRSFGTVPARQNCSHCLKRNKILLISSFSCVLLQLNQHYNTAQSIKTKWWI